jgi:hypothetical protein
MSKVLTSKYDCLELSTLSSGKISLNNLLTNEEKYAAFPDPEASVKTTRA